MAVTLVNEPSGIFPLNGCIEYELSISAPPAGQQNFIAYRLIDELTGNPLTCLEAVDSKGQNIVVRFGREIRDIVETEMHIAGGGVADDDSIEGQVKLEYGEITVEEVNGVCTTVQTIGNFSNVIKVLRSYTGYRDEVDFANGQILSHRPTKYGLCKDAEDAVWIYSPQGGTVNYTAYFPDGTTDTTQTNLFTGASIVPLTPAALDNAFGVGASYLETVIGYGVAKTVTYRIALLDCCCDTDHAELHFREPLGGYSTMTFRCIGDVVTNFQGGISCRGTRCNDDLLDHPDGGTYRLSGSKYSIINRTSDLQLNLRRKFRGSDEAYRWLQTIASADKHYVFVNGTNGTKIRANFLMPSGSLKVYERDGKFELSVTGIIKIINE